MAKTKPPEMTTIPETETVAVPSLELTPVKPFVPDTPIPPIEPFPEPTPTPPPKKTTRRAVVRIPQTHVGEIEVEIPADAANPTTAAIEAAKKARGIISFGAGPEVEFMD